MVISAGVFVGSSEVRVGHLLSATVAGVLSSAAAAGRRDLLLCASLLDRVLRVLDGARSGGWEGEAAHRARRRRSWCCTAASSAAFGPQRPSMTPCQDNASECRWSGLVRPAFLAGTEALRLTPPRTVRLTCHDSQHAAVRLIVVVEDQPLGGTV